MSHSPSLNNVASRASSLVLVLVLASTSCGADTPEAEVPVASLGGTPAAERTFRPLMRRWQLGTPQERQQLDQRLAGFCSRFAGDSLERLARVLRGWNALERGELGRARALAGDAALGAPGVTRDLATLVIGAADRRSGRNRQALERLEPLLHKMIDPSATALLDEELVAAAIGAERWRDALRFMEVSLRETGPGTQAAVSERIAEWLAAVPRSELAAALDQRPLEEEGASRDMAVRMVGQLAALALASNDAVLARMLLDRYGALLGRQGEPIARLAADRTRGRVLARTVGLLLGLRDDELRRRSADIATGMAFGLGIPASGGRLVTRDDGEGADAVRRALEVLAADGAALIVAAVDPAHAPAAIEFSNAQALPIVLVSPDEAGAWRSAPFVFLLGEPPAATAGVLATALRQRGARVVAGFGGPQRAQTESDFGVSIERSCADLPALADLRAERVDAMVVYDGALCGPELRALSERARTPLAIGLGVPGLGAVRALRLGAGVFPIDRAHPDARLSSWLESGRDVPSWWAALGRDAGVLARRAVDGLERTATEEEEVKAFRLEAAAALAGALEELWTSEAQGFGPDRRVPRTVRLIDVGR